MNGNGFQAISPVENSLAHESAAKSTNCCSLHQIIESLGIPRAFRSTSESTASKEGFAQKQSVNGRENPAIESKFLGDISQLPLCRQRMIRIIELQKLECLLAAVIMFNIVLLIVETDAQVDDGDIPQWVEASNMALTAVYLVELCVRLLAYHLKFFRDGWNVMDFCIIFSDVVLMVLDGVVGNMPKISVLRVFRLVRICRAFKALQMFPELALMLAGFANAMKAILVGVTLVLIVLLTWSILAVQLIHPVNKDVAGEGTYRGCQRCPESFASVRQSMLTLFQTIVAGDAWGTVALPIIEYSPVTAIFFLSVVVTVSLAIMNLILAVIVERAQSCMEDTMAERAAQSKEEFDAAAQDLVKFCAQLDTDHSHCLSLEEWLGGYDSKEFADAMNIMGFNREDMEILFGVLDEDHVGEVQYEKCVSELSKFRNPQVKDVIVELVLLQAKLSQMQHKECERMRDAEAREIELVRKIKSLQQQLWPEEAPPRTLTPDIDSVPHEGGKLPGERARSTVLDI